MKGAVLHPHTCERMPELADSTVDLIVTSPPYFLETSDALMSPSLLRSEAGETPDTYPALLDMLARCFTECFRVLKPGGFCVVNVASTRVRGTLYPLPFDLAVRMRLAGWELREEIIWRRWRGWDRRAGSLIKRPYPGYFFPNRLFEYVLVFAKPGPPIFTGRSDAARAASRIPTDLFYAREVANNVWNILPVLPSQKQGHPCPFPDELPARLIELYSYRGDLVLDPFTGSGTTAKAARLLSRRFVGYEPNPGYLRLARARLKEPELRRERRVCRFETLTEPTS